MPEISFTYMAADAIPAFPAHATPERFYGVNMGSCDNLPLLSPTGLTYVG
jgi:hypothetical protein